MVVKIKFKGLFLGIVTLILMLSVAHAAGSRLSISDVDVKVGSKTSNNMQDGDTIDDEAKSGDAIELRVEVKNNFTSSDNIDIKDIIVDATIEGIDDGDDLEEESSQFDLKPNRDKRITLKFQVPTEVDEDTFDVLITAEGEDENGTDQSAQMVIRLDVNKENHLISITKYSLTPNVLACGKRNVQLSVGLENLGTNDEDDVSLRIFNNDLGIDRIEDVGVLTSEPNEDASKFSGTFSFSIPPNVEPDSYPITIRALYDNERRKSEKTATLTMNECPLGSTGTKNPPSTDSGSTSGVVVISSPPSNPGTAQAQPEEEINVPEGTVVTSEGMATTNAFLVGIIIAEVVAVVIGIVLLFTLFKKNN